MKNYLKKHSRAFGLIGAFTSLVVAVIYLKVTPEVASSVGGVQRAILLYGHSLCWLLLSGASLLWSVNSKNKWSSALAYTALGTYLIFMSTLLFTKFV